VAIESVAITAKNAKDFEEIQIFLGTLSPDFIKSVMSACMGAFNGYRIVLFNYGDGGELYIPFKPVKIVYETGTKVLGGEEKIIYNIHVLCVVKNKNVVFEINDKYTPNLILNFPN
jgi:hypothetical protein